MKYVKVGIVGANGYSGAELIRLLLQHPYASIEVLISNSTTGSLLTEQYPQFQDIIHMKLDTFNINEIASRVELLFFATPSGVANKIIPLCLEKGIKCIDLSGDFRLRNGDDYVHWYGFEHENVEYLSKAVYGLAEYNEEKIRNSQLIANPGCFPTATLLGLLPALQGEWIDPNSIIIDGKTGVSGAGRKPKVGSLFSEVNENVNAYKIGHHQHIPEIEQSIFDVTGNKVNISFTTHLIPMTRGIMCTMYTKLVKKGTIDEVHQYYEDIFKDSEFVRVRPIGNIPATKEVYGSNYCDIGLYVDERTDRLIIVSVIDNLVKGASGQAIQNMNLVNGWDRSAGLASAPIFP
ncbi:N-acetyl-gamma-glutamyl-phosphate reductase [Heyndrickxia ginsengihumi]|uniref:N-acetyl-gamma-glutamyl-phosphate reductase n=1 Tax=Heyndrickxia ginsengihumi TaxID=363870 RepID=A0A6M0P9I8_9BACI|nr:N-acetyl-gamma-glutamyl-phosphate reductase [Bacillus sp. (in: firmicutes)]NEY20570.1 N-acetyl-gamma-glutamyl-phosphate reductase [Heyndrickxia ginsengihumi]